MYTDKPCFFLPPWQKKNSLYWMPVGKLSLSSVFWFRLGFSAFSDGHVQSYPLWLLHFCFWACERWDSAKWKCAAASKEHYKKSSSVCWFIFFSHSPTCTLPLYCFLKKTHVSFFFPFLKSETLGNVFLFCLEVTKNCYINFKSIVE